jgi:hypothetical protein
MHRTIPKTTPCAQKVELVATIDTVVSKKQDGELLLAGVAVREALGHILLQAEPIAIALNGVGERPFQKGDVIVPAERLYPAGALIVDSCDNSPKVRIRNLPSIVMSAFSQCRRSVTRLIPAGLPGDPSAGRNLPRGKEVCLFSLRFP